MSKKAKENEKNKEKEFKFKTPCDHYYSVFAIKDPYTKYKFLSPFELKNTLIKMAQKTIKNKKIPFLNAGRGNPNFFSTIPREALSLLNLISCEIGEKLYPMHGLGLMPEQKGISKLFYQTFGKYKDHKAHSFLSNGIKKALEITKYSEDELIHQMAIAALGTFYPDPPQIQPFNEIIVRHFLANIIFKDKKIINNVQLFATEGAAAGIMYIFNSLQINGVINPGDKIGILSPIFSPYLEIPNLHRFQLKMICIQASEKKEWDIPPEELEKIKDKKMKALFLVNPTNPTAQSLEKGTVKKIANIVKKYNPNLVVLTDIVYAPFVDEFNCLFHEIPENTIAVYSFSKYFGVTGWRLGVVIVNNNNVIDKKILPNLPKKRLDILNKRYKIASTDIGALTFMQRLVLDSREVAEAHTGGLSTPQQTIMSFFALQELMDSDRHYNREIKKLLRKRIANLCAPIKYKYIDNKRSSCYYIILDLRIIAKNLHGEKFAQWVHKDVDPLNVVFILAQKYATIVLPGVGFAAPPWSIRVSLANQATESYTLIGKNIKSTFDDLYEEYKKKKN